MSMDFSANLERRIIRSAVDWSSAGLTLIDFLAGRFTYRSAEEWLARISSGEIMINGALSAPEYVLRLHDKVEYFPSDIAEPEADLNWQCVYEDDALLVIDKPGNLCMHPAGPFFRHTLWHSLCSKYGGIHFVSRLDRETSGLLIACRNGADAARLSRPPHPEKHYQVLVEGDFPEEKDAAGFLISDAGSPVRKKRRFVPGDYPPSGADGIERAHTSFRLLMRGNGFSLVEAVPHTGRMHQIRATCFSLGFPVVGDKLYGPDDGIYLRLRRGEISAADRAALRIPRQALHSAYLKFRHPVSGETMEFTSPPPDCISALLRITGDR